MVLNKKDFSSPRAMLKPHVCRIVFDFVNQCEFYILLNGKLEASEFIWLSFIEERINFMVDSSTKFGGIMQKCLLAYIKLLPKIQNLYSYDRV